MLTLNIDSADRRYHLLEQQRDLQPRLNDVTEVFYREGIELALIDLGVRPHEELCLRRLHMNLVFDPDQPETQSLQRWSTQLRQALKSTLSINDANQIQRFKSRAHALTEFGAALAHGDFSPFWAWSQLGLANFETTPTPQQARTQWLSAIQNNPQAPGVVRELLNRKNHQQWLAQFDNAQLVSLAQSVRQGSPSTSPTSNDIVPESQNPRANRLRSESHLVEWLTLRFAPMPPPMDVMLLVVLEVEPAWLSQQTTWLEPVLTGLVTAAQQFALPDTTQAATLETDSIKASPTADVDTPASSIAEIKPEDFVVAASTPQTNERSENIVRVEPSQAENESPLLSEHPTPANRIGDEQSSATDSIYSAYAGLLLMINPMRDINLPDHFVGNDVFAQRPFGWVLEHFALQLLTIPADDPALAVFADRPFDSEPWLTTQAPITAAELEHIVEAVSVMEHFLITRLTAQKTSTIFQHICVRPGRLELSPGWITSFFQLQDVDPELRRIGLDLHPDFVPWLGRIVRFEYE